MLEVLRQFKLDGKLREVRLMRSWNTVLGKAFEADPATMYIRNRVLFVKMRSSVARHELMMRRSEVVRALNEATQASVIDDLVIR